MTPRNSEVLIRELDERDFEDVALLAGQLGYPADASEIKLKWSTLAQGRDEHLVRVAVLRGRVVGWIHALVHFSLVSEPRIEIAGLVVDEQARGKGIGRQLWSSRGK